MKSTRSATAHIRRFRGEILARNQRVRELLDAAGARVTADGDGEAVFEVDLPADDEGPLAFFHRLLRTLIAVISR